MSTEPRFPDCIDCGGREDGTMPSGRCRDCDMDWFTSLGLRTDSAGKETRRDGNL